MQTVESAKKILKTKQRQNKIVSQKIESQMKTNEVGDHTALLSEKESAMLYLDLLYLWHDRMKLQGWIIRVQT